MSAIQLVIGNFLEPKLLGNSLNISPLVALVSLSIWGAFWGVVGMVLSVPFTVIIIILLVGFALANIAMPLTNAFVGEFLMFNGLFILNPWIAAFAGISIVLAAIYTLNMVQKVAYGEISEKINAMPAPNKAAQAVLIILLIIVFVTGVYPQPLFTLTADTLQQLLAK